jgi:prepilin-type N-terminal cleavage/methylation domain-containing protein
MPARRNRGFTLLELFVVIGLAAVVVALLLPAIQKLRSNSYRRESENNLKQITLASIEHADQNENYLNGVKDAAFYANYHISILPQMGNGSLYEEILADGVDAATPFRPYYAPGDPTNSRRQRVTSYIFNDLVFLQPIAMTEKGVAYCNIRFPNSIKDGPAQTIGWLEAYSGTTSGNRDWATSPFCANTNHNTFQIAPAANPTAALADQGQGFYREGIQVSFLDGSVRTLAPALQNSKAFYDVLTPADNDGGSDW